MALRGGHAAELRVEFFATQGRRARFAPREQGRESASDRDRAGTAPHAKARRDDAPGLHLEVERQLVAARRIGDRGAVRRRRQAALALRVAEVTEVGFAGHGAIVAGRVADWRGRP